MNPVMENISGTNGGGTPGGPGSYPSSFPPISPETIAALKKYMASKMRKGNPSVTAAPGALNASLPTPLYKNSLNSFPIPGQNYGLPGTPNATSTPFQNFSSYGPQFDVFGNRLR